jgi:hypothetical protein
VTTSPLEARAVLSSLVYVVLVRRAHFSRIDEVKRISPPRRRQPGRAPWAPDFDWPNPGLDGALRSANRWRVSRSELVALDVADFEKPRFKARQDGRLARRGSTTGSKIAPYLDQVDVAAILFGNPLGGRSWPLCPGPIISRRRRG